VKAKAMKELFQPTLIPDRQPKGSPEALRLFRAGFVEEERGKGLSVEEKGLFLVQKGLSVGANDSSRA
jgi:hypothetical protein